MSEDTRILLGDYLKILREAELPGTRAAAGVNIGFLAANAALGTVAIFTPPETREKLTYSHRAIGFALTAAAVFLSVACSIDEGTADNTVRYISYGYTGCTVIPLILFAF